MGGVGGVIGSVSSGRHERPPGLHFEFSLITLLNPKRLAVPPRMVEPNASRTGGLALERHPRSL